jgi:hypothetical protein
MLLTAPEPRQRLFGVEVNPGNTSGVSSFTDTKTLFLGRIRGA